MGLVIIAQREADSVASSNNFTPNGPQEIMTQNAVIEAMDGPSH